MRTVWAIMLAAVFCGIAGHALAEKRVALVVGNSAYRNVPSLANPVRDAAAVADLFKASGFSTINLQRDLDVAALRRTVGDFAETARDADVAVVYFAGHGIEVDGMNYLIPVDATLARDFDIEDETVSLDRILRSVQPAKRLHLVILDACRDNPFLKTMKRSLASRSLGRGLAKVEPSMPDTLIAFAAKAGSVALDGDSKHSPFTLALLNNVASPGLDLRIAFGRVRDEVLKATGGEQEPFVYGSLGGSIVSFVDAPKPQPQLTTDQIVWNAIKDSTYPAVFEEFLKKFPTSPHLKDANARRDALASEAAAVAARLPPPLAADEVVWNAIKDAEYPAIFDEFAKKFPDSAHQKEARSRRDEFEKKTLQAAPSSPAPPTADEVVWNAIKDSSHPSIFDDFTKKFPSSPHLTSATVRRDDLKNQMAEAAARVPPPLAADEIVWNAIKDLSSRAIFEEFLTKFPESQRKASAAARLKDLKKSQVASFAPSAASDPPQTNIGAPKIDLSMRAIPDDQEGSLKEGSSFRECDKCPEMIVAPTGSFQMGSSEKSANHDAIEAPQHKVTFARPFSVGRYAVTFDEWDTCVADGGCNGYRPFDNGWGRGKRPVINISWMDAKNYVAWLSERTGKPYRLLSEAEREYVTRAGTSSAYSWGVTGSRRQANFDDKASQDRNAKGGAGRRTMPVDSFQPNSWGLYQVHGNIWEWVEDCLNEHYDGAPTDGSAWSTGQCERRILRGGSWVSTAESIRSASRYGIQAEGRASNVGFRVARNLKQ
jgi:formylglycine-generating enzyme required for sulfatase activity